MVYGLQTRNRYHPSMSQRLILGAGMTGLSAGIHTGLSVYEAEETPGGICSSYYMVPGDPRRYTHPSDKTNFYRFEYGGGHWIFGGDLDLLAFIERFSPLKKYARSSAVFLPDSSSYVPYPLQYHLSFVEKNLREKALDELMAEGSGAIRTMADWVRIQFGPSLNDLFFGPFHELYTAGLWTSIRPQDNYKTPLDKNLVRQGARGQTPDIGYNAEFVYPAEGLDHLALKMADVCTIHYGHRVVGIDVERQQVEFAGGKKLPFEQIYSTLPLSHMIKMAGLSLNQPADPHTSVLVLNIGAHRGPHCPDEHWIYVPQSASGFHRVGFYSNVDAHFVPHSNPDRVSLYIERAFLPEEKPTLEQIMLYKQEVEKELQDWGMIGEVEVNDATWVDVAYTWSWPGSTWIDEATSRLKEHNITMLGRYGRWHFQGIAASIKEGMRIE